MFKVGDLVQIKEESLKAHRLSCEPNAVFIILEVERDSYSILGVREEIFMPTRYKLNMRAEGTKLVECDPSAAACFIFEKDLIPYIASRASIDNML